ncbi:hypothetical protein BCR34DRAFT_200517 [Clohesyomyces aquaticus]|uniref:Uncharacterized protein n=1 Tax=Clohesyomyces aquaticus TaxID=1231657 RepID=A0A1Y1YC17_9PLEO|nr:hypothetical protein BCR34DRAFT_200517 [Clohesyomyces aquaticus]
MMTGCPGLWEGLMSYVKPALLLYVCATCASCAFVDLYYHDLRCRIYRKAHIVVRIMRVRTSCCESEDGSSTTISEGGKHQHLRRVSELHVSPEGSYEDEPQYH